MSYQSKAASILRQGEIELGRGPRPRHTARFTAIGRLAFLLAQDRTPRTKDGHAWNAKALQESVAVALAEIDDLVRAARTGDKIAAERIKQLQTQMGYFRRLGKPTL
jgi:hypothetical protein